jgi:hypothetical protein
MIPLDIKGAFNNAWWPFIYKQLKEKKCPKNLYDLIVSYFTERTVIFEIANIKIVKKVTKSCPQGSCLAPILWNIYYDSFLSIELPVNTNISGFADDTALLIKGDTINQIEIKSNEVLKIAYKWSEMSKLTFNIEKTKALLITHKNKFKKPVIKLNNQLIELVDNIKYLGVYIDNKLSWNIHINYVIKKCTKLTFALTAIAENT